MISELVIFVFSLFSRSSWTISDSLENDINIYRIHVKSVKYIYLRSCEHKYFRAIRCVNITKIYGSKLSKIRLEHKAIFLFWVFLLSYNFPIQSLSKRKNFEIRHFSIVCTTSDLVWSFFSINASRTLFFFKR